MSDFLSSAHAEVLRQSELNAFSALWEVEAAWVEPPNHRRGGWSGVVKLEMDSGHGRRVYFVKRQENHHYRTARHGFRKRPTLAREFDALGRLGAAGVPVPDVAFFGSRRRRGSERAILVLPELTGYQSVKDWIREWESHGWPDTVTRRRIAEAVGTAIAALHRQGWCHRALHDKHVFLKLPEGPGRAPEVRLIDLEKARPALRRKRAIVDDLGPLYRRTPQLTARDRLHFFKRYAQAAKLGTFRRPLINTICSGGFHPVEMVGA